MPFRFLDLRLQNGETSRLGLRRGYFLYLVPRELRRSSRRPAVVVARRENGRVGRSQLLYSFAWAPSAP